MTDTKCERCQAKTGHYIGCPHDPNPQFECSLCGQLDHTPTCLLQLKTEPVSEDFLRHTLVPGQEYTSWSGMTEQIQAQKYADQLLAEDIKKGAVSGNILQEADKITSLDRRQEYGSPAESFSRIAALWSVILHHNVCREDVALCMIALKICRYVYSGSRDSLVDIAGYARTIEMMQNEQTRNENGNPQTRDENGNPPASGTNGKTV